MRKSRFKLFFFAISSISFNICNRTTSKYVFMYVHMFFDQNNIKRTIMICIFWILVFQNESSLSPLKFVKILKIPKNCQFFAEKSFKMVQLLYIRALRVHKWGVDTKIKILPSCISKLQAFTKTSARYPIAITQNCKYFEIGMRYLHNFCFYTPFSTQIWHQIDS